MAAGSHPTAFESDLYRRLGVRFDAPVEVINAAYTALMKLHGPRAMNDGDITAKELGEAKAILSGRDRSAYDAYRKSSVRGTIGPYRLLHRVAEGGFGTTYKAEHVLVGEPSCIKHCSEISPTAEMILKQETKAIWNLRHYGIPVMRDLLKLDDGSYALAMSWVDGLTLQQVVEQHGRLDPEHVAWITERILNTLTYLHHHGVVHGDIKPQNIIVQDTTHIVVLVDFGLSVIKPSATSNSKGYTDLFSPPEQVAGTTLIPGSDFYSLGMTMLYALGGGYSAVERKDVPASLPDPMCDFIKSLIVRGVLERPRYAEKVFEDLKRVRMRSFGREHSDMRLFTH